jgi:hypothetical protein
MGFGRMPNQKIKKLLKIMISNGDKCVCNSRDLFQIL